MLKFSGEEFSFAIPSLNGRVYQLEYKDSLEADRWQGVFPLVAGTGKIIHFTHPAAQVTNRFFRIRQW